MATRRRFGAVRKLPSKRWQASYPGPDGKRHTAPFTFDTKDAADRWLNKRELQIMGETDEEWKPPVKPAPPMMFATLAERWLRLRTLKPRTRAHYRWLLDAWILPTFGTDERGHNVPLRQITSDMIEDWHNELDQTKKTACAQAYSLLRTILGDASQKRDASGRRLIDFNPCQIRGAGNVKRKKKIRTATVEQVAALVLAMPEQFRLMILLAAWCGLRFGELTELRRGDLDLKRGVISVERGVVRLKGGERHVDTPKSDAGEREVHIPPHLMPMVREHLGVDITGGRDGLLFPGKNGRQLSSSSFYGRAPGTKDPRTGRLLSPWGFYPARATAGRPDLRLHDLRHTAGTNATQAGASLAEVMAILGHATAGTALLYQHATSERGAEIARRLSEMAAEGGR